MSHTTRDRRGGWNLGAVAFGAGWSFALMVLGGASLRAGADPWIAVSCVAWAQFVCMTMVADRLARPRRPRLAWACEFTAAGVGIAAAATAAWGAPR